MAKKRVVRRDKYGRFKGKGGIKPYKSNLKGVTRKGAGNKKRTPPGQVNPRRSNAKRRIAKGALIVGAAVAANEAHAQITKRNLEKKVGFSNVKIRGSLTARGKSPVDAIVTRSFKPNVGALRVKLSGSRARGRTYGKMYYSV